MFNYMTMKVTLLQLQQSLLIVSTAWWGWSWDQSQGHARKHRLIRPTQGTEAAGCSNILLLYVRHWYNTLNILTHSGSLVTICTTRFNIQQFYVLSTQRMYVFCVYLRTNSDYFNIQHWLVGFYNRDGVCLLRGTFYILCSAHTMYLCVLCGSENKQRLFHCTALTGWFL